MPRSSGRPVGNVAKVQRALLPPSLGLAYSARISGIIVRKNSFIHTGLVRLCFGARERRQIARLGYLSFRGKISSSFPRARTGRNPATGETIKIKAKKTAKFKAGSALAEAVK